MDDKKRLETKKKSQQKVITNGSHVFKNDHFYAGKSNPIIINHKQAIAIALNEAYDIENAMYNFK